MKILFCGTIVPEKYDTRLEYLSPAANRFQINFIKRLENLGHEVKILSHIGFPAETREFEADKEFYPGRIKYVFRDLNIKAAVKNYKKAMKELAPDADMVIAYNCTYLSILVPDYAKKIKAESVLILADFTDESDDFQYRLYIRAQLTGIRKFKHVVCLSEHTKKFLKRKQHSYVMEGGIDTKVFDRFEGVKEHDKDDKTVTFMYAGLLAPVTGVMQLVNAFAATEDPDLRLVISGKGDQDKDIKAAAEKDSRIEFAGYMGYQKYVDTLSNADAVINPRDMSLSENKYNFPSKVMEYLASGSRIISTRFAGNERFKDYIDFCDSNEDALKEALLNAADEIRKDRISGGEKAKEIFERNREFAKNFLWDNQVKRVLEEIGAAK